MVTSACRIILGKPTTSKKSAKSTACLEAMRLLYANGEVDDQLRAVHSKNGSHPNLYEGVAEIDVIVSATPSRTYPTARPRSFTKFANEKRGKKSFKNVTVCIEGVTSMFGFVTDESTADIDFTVDYLCGKSCSVNVVDVHAEFSIFDMQMLRVFHHLFLNTFLRNPIFDHAVEYGYYICPTCEIDGVIGVDWKQVKEVHTFETFKDLSNVYVTSFLIEITC